MVLKKKRAKRSRKGMAWAELRGERYVFLRCLFFFHLHCRRQTVITPDATLVRLSLVVVRRRRRATGMDEDMGQRYGQLWFACLLLPLPLPVSDRTDVRAEQGTAVLLHWTQKQKFLKACSLSAKHSSFPPNALATLAVLRFQKTDVFTDFKETHE